MSKPKPISIEAYKCPKCKLIIEGTYEEAQKHVDVAVDRPLPVGFIYEKGAFVCMVIDKGEVSSSENLKFNHAYLQNSKSYVFLTGEPLRGSYEKNSKVVKKFLKEGAYSLLSLENFKIFKEKLKDISLGKKLKRTTPSLEKLVASGKK